MPYPQQILCRLRTAIIPPVWAAWIACVTLSAQAAENDVAKTGKPDVVAEQWSNTIQPFLIQYCSDCHSGSGAEADIDFAQYNDPAQLLNERPRWNQVRGMIEIGAMPPPDYDPLPSREERESVARWIDRQINSVDCSMVNDPGSVTLRRLNSAEYDNTLRDMFGIDFSPAELVGFPSDGVGNGFDNQGDVLTLSPLQLEKYLQAAKLVASKITVHDIETLRRQVSDIPALYAGDQSSVRFLLSAGEYQIQARLKFEDEKEKRDIPVVLLVDGQEVGQWQIGTKYREYRLDHDFTEGWHELTLHFAEDPYADEKEYKRRIETDFIGVEGPENGQPAFPESHRRLFTAYPDENKSVEQAAGEIFQPLIRRAFRREPHAFEVQRVVNLVSMACEQGESFESAVGIGLQSVLVSPHFIFRSEAVAKIPGEQLGEQRSADTLPLLSDSVLASRLSYFLWASMPDDRLLDLARREKLSSEDQLRSEAKRMLRDARSVALVERFFGQFLGLDNLKQVTPDRERFPLWNDQLRDALRKETELFCQEIIARDLPLTELLAGDFTFVNPRLAELYGLEFEGQDPARLYAAGPGYKRGSRDRDRDGLYKDEGRWLRVSLPENRRGVLTQAAVLTLTSNPTGTSPVKRGKWILESLLGDPPPPAPPNVPSFEEAQKEHADLSLRQQLEIHRSNPSCASCHNAMDPLGLGFENFDAIGQWRESDGTHPIDAAGQLLDGRKFNGSGELIELLQTRQPEILRHFAEKLLTYALGRGLEPYDNCAVDAIMQHAQGQGYRMSAFVEAIVVSTPFRHRRHDTTVRVPE